MLITLHGLRADAVEALGGLPGLTPHLDALIAEADWAGAAVAPSSRPAAATASLLTGLLPSQHGVRHDGAPLPLELTTLAEALRELGFQTTGYLSADWMRRASGYAQGLGRAQPLAVARAAERELSGLDGAPRLVWIDLALPAAPYRRYPALLPRLEALGASVTREALPDRIGRGTVQQVRQRGEPLSEGELRRWRSLYSLNVARADQRLGDLLGALRRSGEWDRAVVAVVSTRGEELGEYGSIAEGRTLRRKLIEVPLVVKLPVHLRGRIALPEPGPGCAVGTVALWSTLVAVAGGRRPPAVAPGLHEGPGAGVLSELRGSGGLEQLSWVEAGDQLLRTRGRSPRVTGAVPAGGRAPTTTVGWRWHGDGEEERLLDPQRLAELARRLERARRLAGGDRETPPPLGASSPAEAPVDHGRETSQADDGLRYPTGTS
ncbi:MAG TPA: sulfatase-like hydrolase/transferase [Thermoanaerobaculia bacterium]|nr:sulfatase-like hydrolase/transferase [Thermoanaerobaculia bacterium]